MTIKEMEERSGMTRANIRFYESEGLLEPVRNENGYRDYSEKDLEILKRIKLLRTLRISLDEIKRMKDGELELLDALEQNLRKLEKEKQDIERSQKVCQVIKQDGARFETLNAQRYLDVYAKGLPITENPFELSKDRVPPLCVPWRRYFARALDMGIYSILWDLFLMLVLGDNIANNQGIVWNVITLVVTALLMFCLEPLQLSVFGTTIGKWILGLYVLDNNERKLTYKKAYERTKGVFIHGMGLEIPIYQLYRNWKSYQGHCEGETLSWEYDSEISLRDERGWRYAAYAGAWVITFLLTYTALAASRLPEHRGELTKTQFCENYNFYMKYYDLGENKLDASGNWLEPSPASQSGTTIYLTGNLSDPGLPEIHFQEKDGYVTGITFSKEIKEQKTWVPDYNEEVGAAMLAMLCAQEDHSMFKDRAVTERVNQVLKNPYEEFEFTMYGIRVTYEAEYSRAGDNINMTMNFDMVKE